MPSKTSHLESMPFVDNILSLLLYQRGYFFYTPVRRLFPSRPLLAEARALYHRVRTISLLSHVTDI